MTANPLQVRLSIHTLRSDMLCTGERVTKKKEKGGHTSVQSLYWSINDALLSGNGFTSITPFSLKKSSEKMLWGKKKVRYKSRVNEKTE